MINYDSLINSGIFEWTVRDVSSVDDAGDIACGSVEDGGCCDGVGDAVGSGLDGVSVSECGLLSDDRRRW